MHSPKRLRRRRVRGARDVLVCGTSILAALALGACGGGEGASSSSGAPPAAAVGLSQTGQLPVVPKRGGELSFARAAEAATLDPLLGITDLGTENTQIQIFDQLVELLPGKAGYQPGLAESWKTSKDGLTYRFTLRDAQFSNGQPVTPGDVIFSLEQADGSFATLYAPMKRIAATGPKEVTIELSQPTPALLGYLCFPPASIVPKRVYQRMGSKRFGLDRSARAPSRSRA